MVFQNFPWCYGALRAVLERSIMILIISSFLVPGQFMMFQTVPWRFVMFRTVPLRFGVH